MTVRGNKNSNKHYKFPKECQRAFNAYCEWIAIGNSERSFTFHEGEFSISYKTMENYIRNYPDSFPPIKKEIAQAKSLEVWEQRGIDMMTGKIEKCQPALYQMFMRNKFGWDKEKDGHLESSRPLVQKLAEKWGKHGSKRYSEG